MNARAERRRRIQSHEHARARAAERYNIHLNREKRLRLVGDIEAGRCRKLGVISWGQVYLATLDGVDAVVVYSRTKRDIITFLPRETHVLAEMGVTL